MYASSSTRLVFKFVFHSSFNAFIVPVLLALSPELKSTPNSFVPNNFMRSTVQQFLLDVPGRVQNTNSLVELYCIVKYVLRAYDLYLSAEITSNDNYPTSASSAALAAPRDGDCLKLEQDKFDVDQAYFDEVGGKQIDTFTSNESVEMPGFIGDISKTGSVMEFLEDADLATLHQPQLSNLSEMLKDSTNTQGQQNDVAPPKPRTSKSKRSEVVHTDYQPATARPRSHAVVNIKTHVTEREYTLRRRLPTRTFLRIIDNEQAPTTHGRKTAFSFFPLEKTWADGLMPNTETEPPGPDRVQSLLEEVSAGTSSSINVARQHVSAASVSGLPALQLAQSQSEGPSWQFFDDIFDTIQDIRDGLPLHTETAGYTTYIISIYWGIHNGVVSGMS
ncbi:PREDICTED: uncharacterized protein LOC108370271 [Rhagoletis zephyria]|nr:PREDICTED: uncharacterized protein LOC108370271 [Rhagoletis zephyria]